MSLTNKLKCLIYGHQWVYRGTSIPNKRVRYCRRCGREELVNIFN